MGFDPISYIRAKKGGLSWADIKAKLESEGALNKQYDPNLSGVFDPSTYPVGCFAQWPIRGVGSTSMTVDEINGKKYIVAKAGTAPGKGLQVFRTWPRYHYGVITWNGKISSAQPYQMSFFGLEDIPGGYGNGNIVYYFDGSSYIAQTYKSGAATKTTLNGQDWTVMTEFKIDWSPTQVVFYINGAQVAVHTTNIPSEPLNMLIEVLTDYNNAPATEQEVWSDFGGDLQ